jgi:hypothetical protein
LRKIKQIIIHCSDSEFGDARFLRRVGKEKGYIYISYHFVILNGKRTAYIDYDANLDGQIENGRMVSEIGAHCFQDNEDSIGICLIGKKSFTEAQFIALKVKIKDLFDEFGELEIYGHYERYSGILQGKTCPNFDMIKFRKDFFDWMLGFRKVEPKRRKAK